jgi:hypothetical protein
MDMKFSPRLRVGYGQGFVQEQETPKLVVRVRSGKHVGRGSYVGQDKQPLAFVWNEDEVVVPERELVVQAGRGGWCLWEDGKPVTLKALFPEKKALHKLDNRFADWQRFFEKHYNPKMPQKFWWGQYHLEGKKLAWQLQAELVDQVAVRYLRPEQDPQSQFAPEIAL